MKKIIHSIFCHKTLPVIDAETGVSQKATYNLLFGFTIYIKYQ